MNSTVLVDSLDDVGDLLPLHRHAPHAFPFLLQSAVADAGRHDNARYDILFAAPGETLTLTRRGELLLDGRPVAEQAGLFDQDPGNDFLSALDARIHANRIDISAVDPELPFRGGWFVYLGYELAGQIEPRLQLPAAPDDLPVAFACRVSAALIRDHKHGTTIRLAEDQAALNEVSKALLLLKVFKEQSDTEADNPALSLQEDPPGRYLQQIERVKRYIVDGDVFQVNLSRGWQADTPAGFDSSRLYQRLRQTNPAPFAGLARIGGAQVVSSSPERLVRVRGNTVETRPIAGTRPRGQDGDQDDRHSRELLAHPKEQAEHVMLIDLERNDLGRVCVPGSIEVNEMMVLESYAHVHHIVSNVRGTLAEGISPGEVLRAVFPGGTITGCPKERCMAIIAELEQIGRGPYTGSMGYINHDGDMDLNILIRTLSVDAGKVRMRAGAGLVADSVASRELEETRHKARGMLLATGALP